MVARPAFQDIVPELMSGVLSTRTGYICRSSTRDTPASLYSRIPSSKYRVYGVRRPGKFNVGGSRFVLYDLLDFNLLTDIKEIGMIEMVLPVLLDGMVDYPSPGYSARPMPAGKRQMLRCCSRYPGSSREQRFQTEFQAAVQVPSLNPPDNEGEFGQQADKQGDVPGRGIDPEDKFHEQDQAP